MMARNTKTYYQVEERHVRSFYSVFKLFNRYYLKSFFGPFFSFVFPVLIYAILGAIMDYKMMLPGIISMSTMSVGLTGLPFSILELKKSVLMKRIGASPVKPIVFTAVIIAYFSMVIMISILWLMLWGLIITHDTSIFDAMGTVTGFFGFWYGILLSIILSVSMGFMIAAVSKNEMQAQAIGMLIMFPSNFLSGQFLSPEVIAKHSALLWISRFIPFRYTTMIVSESWYGNTPFTTGNPFLIHEYTIPKLSEFTKAETQQIFGLSQVANGNDAAAIAAKTQLGAILASKSGSSILWDKADHICGYVVPYAVLGLNLAITIKKFKWSSAR